MKKAMGFITKPLLIFAVVVFIGGAIIGICGGLTDSILKK